MSNINRIVFGNAEQVLKFCFFFAFFGLPKFRHGKGPPRLPILGAYPYLLLLNYKHLHKAVDWLCKYYKSDVIGFYAASFPVVVSTSTEKAKQSLNHPEFDGKPPLMLAKLRDPDFAVQGTGHQHLRPMQFRVVM